MYTDRKFGNNSCIEVEIALPLLQDYYCNLEDKLRNYYRIYKVAKSRIDFARLDFDVVEEEEEE